MLGFVIGIACVGTVVITLALCDASKNGDKKAEEMMKKVNRDE